MIIIMILLFIMAILLLVLVIFMVITHLQDEGYFKKRTFRCLYKKRRIGYFNCKHSISADATCVPCPECDWYSDGIRLKKFALD